MDLGAKQFQIFKIILPQIIPNIISGALIAITLSLDDFTISYFTSERCYDFICENFSMTRIISPKINALSTLMIAMIIVISTITYLFKNKENN